MTHHRFYLGDSLTILKGLPAESVNCCVTSPPYWGLRDYGVENQLGLEKTPEEYVARMVEIFREVRRVLRNDGTLWLNLGDSYAKQGISGMGDPTIGKRNLGGMKPINKSVPQGLKPKDLVGITWRVAFALQADGWYLRSDIIWHKPNCFPESVTDRPTKSHEYIFLLSKNERYYYDIDAIREPHKEESIERAKHPWNGNGSRNYPGQSQLRDRNEAMNTCHPKGRNKRTVWTVTTAALSEAHFATFPPALIEPCILAGCPAGGIVLDCFGGSGTTAWVANKLGRSNIYIDLNPEYLQMALRRNGFAGGKLFDSSSFEVIGEMREVAK